MAETATSAVARDFAAESSAQQETTITRKKVTQEISNGKNWLKKIRQCEQTYRSRKDQRFE